MWAGRWVWLAPADRPCSASLGARLPAAIAALFLILLGAAEAVAGYAELERLLARGPLGIFLNTLTGRPARALAAYDGR
ncbi:MAG TPA: hypothetical protein VK488_04070 [Gaiellaceae bacterium]|nr:hypothetical protein [Gaiellaceae bacterium]